MNIYRHTGNIKAGLFLIGILLVIGLLMYTQKLVESLRDDNREIVKLYAELIASTAAQQSDENLDFIFENIIKKVQFPIIQSDASSNPISWRNLPITITSVNETRKIQKTMDKQNKPIPLVYTDPKSKKETTFGYLHYGDSRQIQRLVWLPYFEIGAVTLFIFLGFAGFTFIRNSEKRYIWVGMARETAHQLGTPVSALMGWIDWLKKQPEKAEKIILEMETDVKRLEQVGERFSKMGSGTDIKEIDLSELVKVLVTYLQRRLPTMGKSITLTNEIVTNVPVKANGTLLSWAIENVIKNGIDAIGKDGGEIIIQLKRKHDPVIMLIRDNGKGILKKDWKHVFRPGFSTKKRGWGLGLSLSYRIIHDIHDGNITISD